MLFFSPQTFFLSSHVTSRFKNVWKILSTHSLFALINSKLSVSFNLVTEWPHLIAFRFTKHLGKQVSGFSHLLTVTS